MAGEGYRLSGEWHPGETIVPLDCVMPYGTLQTVIAVESFDGNPAIRRPEDAGLTITDMD